MAYEEGSDFIAIGTLLQGIAALLILYGLLWWQRVIKYSLPNLIITAVAWPVAYVVWRLIARSQAFPPISFNGGDQRIGGKDRFNLVWAVRTGVSAVPIPAAAWLFGSGLLGLVGVSRRKKAA